VFDLKVTLVFPHLSYTNYKEGVTWILGLEGSELILKNPKKG